MTRAKTTAQWRKEVPAYDRAIRAVESLIANWPMHPHMVAHIHPDTYVVSIVLHGSYATCGLADDLLNRLHYSDLAGRSWVPEQFQGHHFYRKVTQR